VTEDFVAEEEFTSPLLTELQSKILLGIISNWNEDEVLSERLTYAMTHVLDEYMQGKYWFLWRIVSGYYPKTGGIPSPESIEEILQNSHILTLSQKIELRDEYTEFSKGSISLVEYRLAVVRLEERWRDEQYSEILSKTTRIHLGSITENDKVYSGFDDSQVYLREKLHDLELKTHNLSVALEGDINQEAKQVLIDYQHATEDQNIGALTGFQNIDEATNGIQPGELWLTIGFTSEGKSKLSYNFAYNSCYIQGKNVVLGTNEATKTQVHLNMVIRHSHHPKFGRDFPLKYSDVKYGKLDVEGLQFLYEVLDDMKNCSDYGSMFIFQMPARVTPDYIGEVARRRLRANPIGLFVVDYLGLMTSRRRESRREELNDVLVHAKRIALEHNIPFLSPWQTSRQAYEKALTDGGYTKYSLAETSMAERTSDVVISVLNRRQQPNRLSCQILKNRDGELIPPFDLRTDFPTALITSLDIAGGMFD